MLVEKNKTLEEIISKGRIKKDYLKAFGNLISEDYKEHSILPNPSIFFDGFKQFSEWISTVFPDLHIKIEDIIAEEDKVVTRLAIKINHQDMVTGDIFSTGKRVVFSSIEILKIVDGKIKEQWNPIDLLTLLKQIGVISDTVEKLSYDLHPQY